MRKIIGLTKIAVLFSVLFAINLSGQSKIIAFDSASWDLKNARVVEFQGREAMTGDALLKDVLFKNGIIEADLWVDGSRSYPALVFRSQSKDEYEHVYVRPHRAGLYDDAIQYAPTFNGQTCWQLYYGIGCTAESNFKSNKWLHLKLIVKDAAAQFFIDDMTKPALIIQNLAHGISNGAIILSTTAANNYFSNFKINMTDDIELKSKDNSMQVLGNITEWEISKLFSEEIIRAETYPYFYNIYYADFEKIRAEQNGLINISRYRKIERQKNQCVYARTFITSEADKTVKIAFGYNDAVKIFLNQKIVYSGDYAYRSRSNSFTGTISLHDTLYLDLIKGVNELFLVSLENYGGWGFAFKSVTELKGIQESETHPVKLWETKIEDMQPESVIYDSINNVIYCSQFDVRYFQDNKPRGFISKINLNGEIIDLKWIDSLYAPAGICQYRDKLYVLERKCLTEVSVKSGKVTNRYPLPDEAGFPNDIAADEKGNLYITNSEQKAEAVDILLFKKNHFEKWLVTDQSSGTNGILYTGKEIVFGNSGKGLLQAIDIKTKNIRTIASIGAGIVDGIKMNNGGNFLVSTSLTGILYEVTGSGKVSRLINAGKEFNIANFNYLKRQRLLLIPTFLNSSLQAYKMDN